MPVIATSLLINGLRSEFDDTYEKIRQTQADSRLAKVMDLGTPQATNREHTFAYVEAAPHMEYWERDTPIPEAAMDSVDFTVPIYEWGRRVPWSKWDRKDDQTGKLMQMARGAGRSAGLIPERIFFDLLQGTTKMLPSVPNAPDGVALYNATDSKGNARFGVTGGNVITGSGTTAAQIIADMYDAIQRWKRMEDGQGQPLLSDDILEAGLLILHPVELTEAIDQAFFQKRQVGSGGSTPSNINLDVGRNLEFWNAPRLDDTNDWYIFLQSPPTQATFFMDRQGVMEFTALEGDNNDGENRTKAREYIQWEARSGGGAALPYATMKVSNA